MCIKSIKMSILQRYLTMEAILAADLRSLYRTAARGHFHRTGCRVGRQGSNIGPDAQARVPPNGAHAT